MPDCSRWGCGLEQTAEQVFYFCERVRPFLNHARDWTTHTEPKQFKLPDVGNVVDNVLLQFHGEKHMVFLAILTVARIVI